MATFKSNIFAVFEEDDEETTAKPTQQKKAAPVKTQERPKTGKEEIKKPFNRAQNTDSGDFENVTSGKPEGRGTRGGRGARP
jgi:hypothetical protein